MFAYRKKLYLCVVKLFYMEKRLNQEEINAASYRKQRNDIGKHHKAHKHGGKKVGQYNFAGELEREFDSLADAAEDNDIGATYQGILFCCQGKIRKHCNKIWRFEEIKTSTIDLSDNI